MSESLLRFLSLRCFVSLSRTRGLLGFANLRRPFVDLVWSLNCRKCITSCRSAQGGLEKKLKKVLGRSAPLFRAFCWAETFLEALCLLRSVSLPLVRARGAHCKTACARGGSETVGSQWREAARVPLLRCGRAGRGRGRSSGVPVARSGKSAASPMRSRSSATLPVRGR